MKQNIRMKKISVVAAIVKDGKSYLCTQRGKSKYSYVSEKYEFPGGKVEEGETEEEALEREIQEELSMNVNVGEKLIVVNHEYPDFTIEMHCFLCTSDSRKVVLHEHIDHKWLTSEELNSLDWAAADLPIVEKLLS